GEQDAVALLDVERQELAVLAHLALADRDHLALGRLLLRRVGDDDPALRLLFLFDPLHQNPILQRTDFHGTSPWPATRSPGWVGGMDGPKGRPAAALLFGSRTSRVPKREVTVATEGRPARRTRVPGSRGRCHPRGVAMASLEVRVAAAQRRLCAIYRLELPL